MYVQPHTRSHARPHTRTRKRMHFEHAAGPSLPQGTHTCRRTAPPTQPTRMHTPPSPPHPTHTHVSTGEMRSRMKTSSPSLSFAIQSSPGKGGGYHHTLGEHRGDTDQSSHSLPPASSLVSPHSLRFESVPPASSLVSPHSLRFESGHGIEGLGLRGLLPRWQVPFSAPQTLCCVWFGCLGGRSGGK